MMQATKTGVEVRALTRAEVADAPTAEVIVAVADLLSSMQRSRMLHQQGAPAVGLLIHLAKFGAMRPTELAGTLHIDASTVSRHIARLEADGLLERTEDPHDRRACVIELTEAGTDAAREALQERIHDFAQLIHDWSENDRLEFARLLSRFVDDFDMHLKKGTPA